MRKFIVLIFALFLSYGSYAQFFSGKTSFTLKPKETKVIDSNQPLNGFAVLSQTGVQGLGIIMNDSLFRFKKNDDMTTDEMIYSTLIVLDKAIEKYVLVNNSETSKTFNLIEQYAPPIKINFGHVERRKNSCDRPNYISPTIWRQGLPLPKITRSENIVKHVVVHHSADGNGNTDYTSLVRSYYIYHTQTKGWDDIGYNFLIAADGTVFQGRDSMESKIDIDNVRGAHYCGKNQGTMGICIIGDYTNFKPSFSAINSLVKLSSWKLHKEQLFPYDSFAHPISSSPKQASFIGHRQGCSTACPGDLLFGKMNDITENVNTKVVGCSPLKIDDVFSRDKEFVYYSEGYWILSYDKVGLNDLNVIDIQGQNVSFISRYLSEGQVQINLKKDKNSLCFLQIKNRKGEFKVFKLLQTMEW